MGSFKQFKVCPVCGHKLWCTWSPSNDPLHPNDIGIFCHYIEPPKKGGVVQGADGGSYIGISPFSDGWIFRKQGTVAEEQARKKAWIEDRKRRGLWEERGDNQYSTGWVRVGSSQSQKKPETVEVQSIQPEFGIVKPKTPKELGIKIRSNADLDQAYRVVARMLHLLPKHKEKMLEDGWSIDLLKENDVVSFPMPDRQRWQMQHDHISSEQFALPWRKEIVKAVQCAVGEDLSGIPGFYLAEIHKNGVVTREWRMAGPESGILFFSNDVQGHYFGAQIRLDQVTSKKGKYRPLSTNPEKVNEAGKPYFPGGTMLPEQPGIVYYPERDDSTVAYVTEGRKKAVIGNDRLHLPIVSLSGVGKFAYLDIQEGELNMIQYLKKQGTRIVVVAYDADKAVNQKVLQSEQRLVKLLKQEGFRVAIANWNPRFGKGLDDILVKGIYPTYEEV